MIKRLDKLPKRTVTIDEILDKDDLVQMIGILKQDDVVRVMLIYTTKDGGLHLKSNGQTYAYINWDLDQAKRLILTPDKED